MLASTATGDALAGALTWISDQDALAPRADHLFTVVAGAILTARE